MSIQWNVEGDWEFCFEPDDSGMLDGWQMTIPSQAHKVKLPHSWAQEKNWSNQNAAYYYKAFEVDKAESPKRFYLQFDAIDHYSEIWLNGELLGKRMGGGIPFRLDASKCVKVGETNFLAMRVESPGKAKAIGDRNVNELPVGSMYKKTPFAGLRGGFHLLMGGRAGIRHINCFPDYEADRVTAEIKFWNPKNFKAEMEFTLTAPDGTRGTLPKLVKLEKENDTYNITFDIDKAEIWTLESPKLYHLKVDLLGCYSREVRFGLRRVEIERCMIKLNHDVVRLKGVTYTPIFPYLTSIAPMDFSYKEDLLNIKNAGFNLIRSGGTPLTNEILDLCDEIGLLVIQESPSYNQKSNKDSLEELKKILKRMMEYHGYHPCIVMWAIGSENGSMALENGNKLLRFCSDIDPYRPIASNLNSVHLDSMGVGKIDIGKVYNPTETKIETFESHSLKMAAPLPVKTQYLMANYCTSKEAKTLNDNKHGGKSFWERYNYLKDELGGKVLVDGIGMGAPRTLDNIIEHDVSKKFSKSREYKWLIRLKEELENEIPKIGIWKKVSDFLEEAEKFTIDSVAKHVESLGMNNQISGFLFEKWSDWGLEFGGLVDHFRQPKPILEEAKKMNAPIKIMSEAELRTPYQGASAAIKIFLLNEDNLGDYGLLVRVKGPNGRIWHQESMPGKAKRGLNSIGRFKFPVGNEVGEFTFDLALTEGKKEIAKKEEVFFVPQKVELDDYLKKVNLIGNFPNTISYAAGKEEKNHLITNPASMDKETLSGLFEKAANGDSLIFGALTPEDVEQINNLKLLDFPLELIRNGGGAFGYFNYCLNHAFFEGLPNQKLAGEIYADLLPLWSFLPVENPEIASGALIISQDHRDNNLVDQVLNSFSIPYKSGKIIFHQFLIFDKLGKNALSDVLFANLVKSLG